MRQSFWILALACACSSGDTGAAPPEARRDVVVDDWHGVKVPDPYRWLESETQPEVQAWMDAQDRYARAELAKLPGRAELGARLEELFYYDEIGAPIHRNGRYFYTRMHKDKEKAVVYWRTGADGEETVLFDPNTWSTDGTKGLGGWWPTYDGRVAAYNVKENNADESVMHVIDIESGKDRADVIPGTKYSGASWTPDGSGFYYTWLPPPGSLAVADRPGKAEVRFHELGDDPAEDAIVHPATNDPSRFIGGVISRDGHWLIVSIQHGWTATDVYYKDARKLDAAWTRLVVGVEANFDVIAWRDKFYVFTNDGAPRYRIFQVDPWKPDRKEWKEILPESRDGTLAGYSIVGEKLVVEYLRNAASEMEVYDLDGKLVRKVELPPLGTTGGIDGNPDEDTGYFVYTSFTEPTIIYKTSIKTGEISEWARVELPIDTSQLTTEQVWYPSKDGAQISMFIIRKKDVTKNGKNLTILDGYGGFGVPITPSFWAPRMAWLEQGGIYAIPNLRGGGEYGEDWHRAGMRENKQNVFDDLIGAAEHLIADGWTSPRRLAIFGASNGGLLVGAAMVQAPEAFGAVVCAVPLLDMVRYHKFGSGMTWIEEYGSADNKDEFQYLYAYSPYHQVKDGAKYPPLLMLSADHDDRVDPMHARKFTAQLQYATGGQVPVLLRIERNAGHAGADLVKQQLDETADVYAWLWSVLGGR